MSRGVNGAGVPVVCLLPGAERKRMMQLSGDMQVTNLVSSASPRDVGTLCAVLLRSLSPAERRDAMRVASAGMSGPQLDCVPLTALMPARASIEQIADLWNGLVLLLLSLGTASADTSVGTVVANAAAMGSGKPFAADPLVGERQNEVVLAKAILEAALLGDEEAQKWFEDNQLSAALANIAKHAEGGTSDASDEFVSASDYLQQLYDCVKHTQPLGGDALAGSTLASFIDEAVSGLKNAAGKAVKSLGDQLSSKITDSKAPALKPSVSTSLTRQASPVSSRSLKLATLSKAVPVESASQVDPATVDASSTQQDISEQLSDSIGAAKEAIAEARKAIEAGSENIASYREKLKNTALKNARLQWAQSILDSGDDVAAILSAATPNMADPGSFLQSMLSTLPAAKETGNLGTIKALVYALRAAAGKGDGSANSLYSLLTGDIGSEMPSADQYASSSAYAHQKAELRALLTQPNDVAEAAAEQELGDEEKGGQDGPHI